MSEQELKTLHTDVKLLNATAQSLEKRMDKMEEINEAVWKISSNVELMAQQIKETNTRFNDHIQRIYTKLEKQSEEHSKAINVSNQRIEDLEKKPAKKWETVSAQVLGIIIAAVVGFVLASIGLSG